jgi:uncharacterized protein (TIGR03437 family)
VYIADSGNNRILIFGDPNTSPARGATAAFQIGSLGSPRGVFVSPATGEIWVTNSNSGTAVKYPTFDNLLLGITTTTTISSANVTLGLALDQNGDLFVADASNRVAIYYPTHATINAANGLTSRPLAPGMAASIYSGGIQFTSQTVALDRYPMPVTMADTQVLFNDKPVPLYFVSPGQINFLVPNGAPTSGTADILVVRASTGQVLSGGTVTMNSVSPGIFAIDSSGKTRRAAVLNQDGSVNDPTNPAARGSVISIYATGNGNIPNAPKDGDAASGLITTPLTPRIVIGSYFVDTGYPVQAGDPQDGSWVKYSGLAPGFAGLWQVNVQIPMGAAPGNQVPVAIIVNDMGSWDTSNPNNFITTIAVK